MPIGSLLLTLQPGEDRAPDLEVARRRARPCLVILDDDMNVVCAEGRAIDFLSQVFSSDERSEALPKGVRDAIADIVRERSRSSGGLHTEALLSVGMLLLRVVPLTGEGGSYTAVFVEPHAKREHLQRAAERYGLSKREREVLGLMVRGYRGAGIAESLCISTATVNDHVKNLLKKTDARSRSEMLVKIFGE
jgi:DNA-binding NarL/FixJ family response regulator